MAVRIGLDVGSATVKMAAILGPEATHDLVEPLAGSSTFRFISDLPERWRAAGLSSIIVSECRRSLGNPFQAALDLLREFQTLLPDSWHAVTRITGSGGHHVAEALNLASEKEFKAIARGVSELYPQIRTVFEMGGENSKYLLLDASRSRNSDKSTDLSGCSAGILDYATSSQCAGTEPRLLVPFIRPRPPEGNDAPPRGQRPKGAWGRSPASP